MFAGRSADIIVISLVHGPLPLLQIVLQRQVSRRPTPSRSLCTPTRLVCRPRDRTLPRTSGRSYRRLLPIRRTILLYIPPRTTPPSPLPHRRPHRPSRLPSMGNLLPPSPSYIDNTPLSRNPTPPPFLRVNHQPPIRRSLLLHYLLQPGNQTPLPLQDRSNIHLSKL